MLYLLSPLGGYGSGVLYIFSAATALFGSNPIVTLLGPRKSLLVGMGFYCVYVSCFLLAVISHNKFPFLGWISFLMGSMFGGIASGIVWTAQGRYFSLNAQQYAAEVSEFGIRSQKVTNRFAGLFACIFLGTECFLRAFASVFFLGEWHVEPTVCCLYDVYVLVVRTRVGNSWAAMLLL